MKAKVNQIDNTKEWFVAIVLFIMTSPYFVWHSPIRLVSVFLFYGIAITHSSKISQKYVGGFILLSFFYFLVAIRYGLKPSMLYTMLIPIVFLINKSFFCRCFEKFVKIFAICMSVSLFIYVLVVVFKINLPYSTIVPLNSLKEKEGYSYLRYLFLICDPTERGIIMRFYGIYDEPGVVGTISSIILASNKYAFKKNRFLIPVFIAGFFSFSLFFYVVSIVSALLLFRKKNAIYVLLFVVIVIYALSFIPGADILVFNRFSIEKGIWLGNSRSVGGYDEWFRQFIRTPDVLLGLGPGANLLYNKGGASYKDLITNYGIIMFSIYLFSLIILITKTKSTLRERMIAALVILGYIFQRPFVTDVFMVLSIMYVLFNNEEKEGNRMINFPNKV